MTRAPTACGEPGCPDDAAPGHGRCPRHQPPAWQGAGGRRGGTDWRYRTVVRPAVLARDGYRCRDCGATGVPLEVDHLDRIADGGPLNAPMHRLETVCVPCHRKREAARNRRGPA
jgi:hypothetical protein